MRTTSYIFILGISVVSLFLSACGKDDPITPPENTLFKGDFVSSAHTTKGLATIDSSETTLTLTDFKTDSGPDLNIYIASNINNVTSDFIDLGDIKGVNGDYTYTLPDNIDYEDYKYVIVWCVAFDVNFGYAELARE
jgi:hypothetical protein